MILTLVGMSGVGKTYFSNMLEKEKNFARYDCDERILKRIEDKLPEGSSVTDRLSKWMGFPGDVEYEQRKREYMHLEEEVMNEILDEIEKMSPEEKEFKNIVIDTTGSVIHTSEKLQSRLQKDSTYIAYLESDDSVMPHLLENLIADKKPIAWPEGTYNPLPGESQEDARLRCFPDLVNYRAGRYNKIKNITVQPEQRRGIHTGEAFLTIIRSIVKEKEDREARLRIFEEEGPWYPEDFKNIKSFRGKEF